MRHPGSFRDASSSLRKIAATSASLPGFAFQVTAKTTMDSTISLYAVLLTELSASEKASTNIVCSRSGPVETIPTFAPVCCSMNAK